MSITPNRALQPTGFALLYLARGNPKVDGHLTVGAGGAHLSAAILANANFTSFWAQVEGVSVFSGMSSCQTMTSTLARRSRR